MTIDTKSLLQGRGAVAVVDALGFRAARRGEGASERLIEAVRAARGAVHSQVGIHHAFGGVVTRVAAFSDSIIIASFEHHNRDPSRWGNTTIDAAVNVVATAASALFDSVRDNASLPLAYRGCITVDDLASSDDVFVGSSIDEAAEWYEQADAALVWLTPRASASIAPLRDCMTFFTWPVPLKGRGEFEALTVNPFYHCVIAEILAEEAELNKRMDEVETRLLETFGAAPPVDVARKLQQTKAFLAYARKKTLEFFPGLQQEYLESRQQGAHEDEDEVDG